jgi:hypothetical protein
MASEPTTPKSSSSGWFLRFLSIIIQVAILGVLIWIGILLRLLYRGLGMSSSYYSGLEVSIAGMPTVAVYGMPTVSVYGTPTVMVGNTATVRPFT